MQREEILKIIGQIQDPYTGQNLDQQKSIARVEVNAASLECDLRLPYPSAGLDDYWLGQIAAACPEFDLQLNLSHKVRRHQASTQIASHPKIKNIIAIASCKGGVGKSTTCLGLAMALKAQGAKVAVLDADIHGPNLPDLLRLSGQAGIKNQQFQPVMAAGLPTMSIAYCIDDDKPAIWRGPMVSRAVEQLYQQTAWPELDYLLIDMPPGTGDIQLTISKKIPLAGVVMVSTAETLALVDTIKGIEMFDKVAIPVLGLVENMAQHICSSCGHKSQLFNASDMTAIAERYKTTVLGNIAFSAKLQHA